MMNFKNQLNIFNFYIKFIYFFIQKVLIDICLLGICLVKQGPIVEAKDTLKFMRASAAATTDDLRGVDSHLKAFERAQEMLRDLESKLSYRTADGNADQRWLFEAFIGSTSIWQLQPCVDYLTMPLLVLSPEAINLFADENVNTLNEATLNIDASLFFSSKLHKELNHDPLASLKRTRSGNTTDMATTERWPELPDNKEFDDAIVAAILGPILEDEQKRGGGNGDNMDSKTKTRKRSRIFQDIL